MKFFYGLFSLVFVACPFMSSSQKAILGKTSDSYQAYLFAYFTGNSKSEEAIHFAISLVIIIVR